MALTGSSVFEVRGGSGNDTNGGGFDSTGSGTDYSQQNAKNTTGSNISVTNAVANGTTTITSTTAAFTSAINGNIIYLQGGTGSLAAGWYRATFVSATSITVDRTVATGTGITMNIGGAFNTIGAALALMILSSMITWVKSSATYSIGTGLSTPAGSNIGTGICRVVGYTTTRGDSGKALIQTTAAINAWSDSTGGFILENMDLNGNSVGSNGFNITNACSYLYNCTIRNFLSGAGAFSSAQGGLINCIIQGNASGVNHTGTGLLILNCYFVSNTGVTVSIVGQGTNIIGNVFASNTGASTDGVQYNGAYSYVKGIVEGNVFYACGRHGINSPGNYDGNVIRNNIFVNNGGYGINYNVSVAIQNSLMNYNAFYNNTSGARNGVVAGANDITLTGVPFVNAGSGNFALNATAGAGASCRNAGFPGTMGAGTGYADVGALQHPDPSSFFNTQGQTGGFNG